MTKTEIREAIREKVLMSEIPPGAWVDEEELAREFRVSRTPIREICMYLAAERVLDHHPGQGAQTPRIDLERVRSMLEMARIIYPKMHAGAARRMSEADHETLAGIVAEIGAVEGPGVSEEGVRLRRRFLATCATLAGNCFMAWFGNSLAFEECRVLRHVLLMNGHRLASAEALRTDAEGFARICDAMRTRDEPALETAVLDRIVRLRTSYLGAFDL